MFSIHSNSRQASFSNHRYSNASQLHSDSSRFLILFSSHPIARDLKGLVDSNESTIFRFQIAEFSGAVQGPLLLHFIARKMIDANLISKLALFFILFYLFIFREHNEFSSCERSNKLILITSGLQLLHSFGKISVWILILSH